MSPHPKTVLCIDDQPTALAGWCLYLRNAGYTVFSASSAQEGLEVFATRPIDAVILDYAMPEMDGDEVAAAMKHIKPTVRIIMLSGVTGLPRSGLQHVDWFITKGQQPNVLLETLQRLLQALDTTR